MANNNNLNKRIIQALTTAPATALQQLLLQSSPEEQETIRRIALALNINLPKPTGDGKEKE